MIRLRPIYYWLFLVLVFTMACSTKKNKLVHRTFHNITSRFNGYYYAEESVKEGLVKIKSGYKENYSKILPVFVYADAKDAKSIYPEMDKAIKKSSVVIQRHTITDKKGKEIPGAVKWIDENYIVLGKAHFYKHDFFSALESFEYVSKVYDKSPNRFLAMMWMIRTYNEIGSFSLSEPIIAFLNNEKKFPKNFNEEFAAVSADYYLKRANYEPAIKNLSKAYSISKNKKRKVRYAFILAQLYQIQGDNKKAAHFYEQVVRLHPEYEMAFNAKINRAKLYDANSGESKSIKKILSKMLKDIKNKEYQDQIYYTLAEIEEKEKNMPSAISYLKLSVKSSVSNNNQKALSYLKLADIYFSIPQYPQADAYYDSTMVFLSKDYVDYESISTKKKNLNSLIASLTTISREDSLQRVAKMSDGERNRLIEKIIAQVEADEKRKEEEKEMQQLQANSITPNTTATNPINNGPTTGAWYFYNASSVAFGVSDFVKKWGQRKLEDNWRRKNKESSMAMAEVESSAQGEKTDNASAKTDKKTSDLKNKDYYLKNLPLTDELVEKSNLKIIDAYYNAGSIYKEALNDLDKSIESFETLLKRFPKNKHQLSSYYQLYRIYLSGNNNKADYYKNIILKDFADSEYASIIKNPNYGKETMASKSLIEKFYDETYNAYNEGKYETSLLNCKLADSLYTKNYLMPKFDLLYALSIGRTQPVEQFEKALNRVIVRYPKDEVKNKAQEILDYIKKQKPTAIVDTVKKSKYLYNEELEQYWAIVIKNKKGDINKFKIALSDFNGKYYGLANLSMTTNLLDSTNQFLIVKSFPNKIKGFDYYQATKNEKNLFKDLQEGTYDFFLLSAENYATFYKEKNIIEYLSFFTANYLANSQ